MARVFLQVVRHLKFAHRYTCVREMVDRYSESMENVLSYGICFIAVYGLSFFEGTGDGTTGIGRRILFSKCVCQTT